MNTTPVDSDGLDECSPLRDHLHWWIDLLTRHVAGAVAAFPSCPSVPCDRVPLADIPAQVDSGVMQYARRVYRTGHRKWWRRGTGFSSHMTQARCLPVDDSFTALLDDELRWPRFDTGAQCRCPTWARVCDAAGGATRQWLTPRLVMPTFDLPATVWPAVTAIMSSLPAEDWHGTSDNNTGHLTAATGHLGTAADHRPEDGPVARCSMCLIATSHPLEAQRMSLLTGSLPASRGTARALKAMTYLRNVPDPDLAAFAVRAGLTITEAGTGWKHATWNGRATEPARTERLTRWRAQLATLAELTPSPR